MLKGNKEGAWLWAESAPAHCIINRQSQKASQSHNPETGPQEGHGGERRLNHELSECSANLAHPAQASTGQQTRSHLDSVGSH
ncbi:hypothetical protein AOLI_G00075650 [Acnodon oligacanthus]